MPRTPLQYKQIKDERKLSILEASLPLFSLYGNKVSIDSISEKAKCSHGLVYHYFKNTDAVLEELLKSETYLEIKDELFVNFTNRLAIEIIDELVNKLIDVNDVVKASYLNIIISDYSKKSFKSEFVKLVARGQKEGDVTGGDPNDITQTLFLMLKGIYLIYLTNKKASVDIPSIDNIMNIIRKR